MALQTPQLAPPQTGPQAGHRLLADILSLRPPGAPPSTAVHVGEQGDAYFSLILNPDGSIRWAFPAGGRQADYLAFYAATGPKARLRRGLARGAARLGLQDRLAPGRVGVSGALPLAALVAALGGQRYALFTGTAGAMRKSVVAGFTGREADFFLKIAHTSGAAARLAQERDFLTQAPDLAGWAYPRLLPGAPAHALALSNVRPTRGYQTSQLGPRHLDSLRQWQHQLGETAPLAGHPWYAALRQRLNALTALAPPAGLAPARWQALLAALDRLADLSPRSRWLLAPAHGDFTPWNLYLDAERLYAFDWELYEPAVPAGYDLFHFVFQTGVLVHRQRWPQLLAALRQAWDALGLSLPLEPYLGLYFAHHVSQYLTHYAHSGLLHPQSWWLLETWEAALTRP